MDAVFSILNFFPTTTHTYCNVFSSNLVPGSKRHKYSYYGILQKAYNVQMLYELKKTWRTSGLYSGSSTV